MLSTRTLPGTEVAQTISELYAATDVTEYEAALNVLVERASTVGVAYTAAARQLGVSRPTVRTWMERGVLDEAEGLPVRAVTAASLGRTLALLTQIDVQRPALGQLIELAEAIRDRDLLHRARSVSERGASEGRRFPEVTDSELDSL